VLCPKAAGLWRQQNDAVNVLKVTKNAREKPAESLYFACSRKGPEQSKVGRGKK